MCSVGEDAVDTDEFEKSIYFDEIYNGRIRYFSSEMILDIIQARQHPKELVLVKMNGGNLMDKDPFKEYIKQSEPSKRDKGYAWHTAIGLQAVDGLKPSKYLIDMAIKNIEGDIIKSYLPEFTDMPEN